MDWMHTITIIGTILSSIAAFYYIVKKDLDRHDVEFSEVRKEFAETRKLWASLLEKIYKLEEKSYKLEEKSYKIEQEIKDIKLFIAPTSQKK